MLAAVLLVAAAGAPAAAQPAPSAAPEGRSDGGRDERPAAVVEGFRSARFGMSEAEVRRAVQKDFPAQAARLKIAVHPSEKTTVLALTVSDLLPHTGTAQVSYILGYRSKTLIQINIVWHSDASRDGDETVVGTANSLRDYFLAQGWKPGSELANRRLGPQAIVVFRGADAQGRMVLVALNGTASAERKAERPAHPPPLTLELSYIADPLHPDVFRIGKGQF